MPWKKKDGTIIKAGQSWIDDNNIVHPSNWMIWSDTDKKAVGLTWEDLPKSEEPFDNRFYKGRKTDGTLIEHSLIDVKVTDKDGKAVLGIDGNQLIQKGVKTIWIERTKTTANDLLSKTDWMITRKSEKGTAIPDAVTKYRDSVRTACNTIENKINDCTKLSEFIALFDGKLDGSNAPIYDFPKETSE